MSSSSQQKEESHYACMTPTRGSGNNSNPASGAASQSSSWAPPNSPSHLTETQRMSNLSPKAPHVVATTTTSPNKKEHVQQQKDESIQDKIGNMAGAAGSNALLGVLELLKVAGGATLSTTGKIVAPPLHVTRTVLLPSLWVALKDYVSSVTPQRVKDWFRICSSSLYHIHSVLIATDRGKELQTKVGTVGVDVLDVASSDASRQALVDGMACLVKLSEALHTPETKALLDQMSVLGCRLVDAASTGRAKQLLHDTSDCVWAAIELYADPAATLAFAEVTAYFCHALEMENALHRPLSKSCQDPKFRAQRRRDRNRFERDTYVDPHLLQDPDGTVEQAILSSIGSDGPGGGSLDRHAVNHTTTAAGIYNDSSSLPSNVVFSEQQQEQPTSQGGSHDDGMEDDDDDEHPLDKLERDWEENANDVVDVAFLQEKIAQRAAQKEENAFHRTKPAATVTMTPVTSNQQQYATKLKDDDDEVDDDDIEDLAQPILEDNDADPAQSKNAREHVELKMEKDNTLSTTDSFGLGNEYMIPLRDPLEPTPALVEEEPATAQFYRTLDEIMSKKRNETVDALLQGQYDDKKDLQEEDDKKPTGKARSWYPKAAAAAGAGNEQGQDTIAQKVSTIRSALKARAAAIGVGKEDSAAAAAIERPRNRPPTPLEEALDRYTVLLGLFLGFLAIVATIWFGFGCYGIYVYFFGHGGMVMETEPPPTPPPAPVTQELVIRIVREVVHLSATGEVIETGPDIDAPHAYDADDIAACVADAIR